MAVIDSAAPGGRINRDRQPIVREAFEAAIDAAFMSTDDILPVRIRWSGFRGDFFWAVCLDKFSVDFLEKLTNGIKLPWDNVRLQMVGKDGIPKLRKVTVEVKGPPKPIPAILSQIKQQNNLPTELWTVYNSIENPQGLYMVLGIDQDSFDRIKEAKGEVWYRMVSLFFKLGNKETTCTTQNPASSSAVAPKPSPVSKTEGGANSAAIVEPSGLLVTDKATGETDGRAGHAPMTEEVLVPSCDEDEELLLLEPLLASEDDQTLTQEIVEELGMEVDQNDS